LYILIVLIESHSFVQVGELAENTCPHCGDIMLASTRSPVF